MNETMISIGAAALTAYTAAGWDIHSRKIPNFITLGGVSAGVLFHVWVSGVEGMVFSGLGCGTGLGVLLLPYCLRVMGAGDVKLMMALGAWVGAAAVWFTMVYTALWGGVIGLWMLYRAGMLNGFWVRLYLLTEGGPAHGATALRLDSSACPPLPYGAVIALGYSTHVLLSLSAY